MNRPVLAALVLLLFCACVSTNQAARPGGDEATIVLADRTSLRGELLALTGTDIYFLSSGRVWQCPLAELKRVSVEGYDLRAAKYVTLGLFGAADVALTWLWASTGCWPLAVPAVPMLAIGAITALDAGPQVDYRAPFTDPSLAELSLYCRYPRGLTEQQWQDLLRFYAQDGFSQPRHLTDLAPQPGTTR